MCANWRAREAWLRPAQPLRERLKVICQGALHKIGLFRNISDFRNPFRDGQSPHCILRVFTTSCRVNSTNVLCQCYISLHALTKNGLYFDLSLTGSLWGSLPGLFGTCPYAPGLLVAGAISYQILDHPRPKPPSLQNPLFLYY